MERHERVSAITQSLPGLESFLRDVLANETLTPEADKQRKEFIRRLDFLSQPPSLPPRPTHLCRKRSKNHYDRRAKLYIHNVCSSGSQAPISQTNHKEDPSPYNNESSFVDPVEFASQQRELARNKNYGTRKDVLSDGGNRADNFGGSAILETPILPGSKSQRSSFRSSSSYEDDIYEHLHNTTPEHSPLEKDGEQKGSEPFVFGSPPKKGGEPATYQNPVVSFGSRGTSLRGSGGKGKLTYATGWFKKEAKVYEEIFPSSLTDPTKEGWLKDIKSNKKRLCIIKDHRLYIFKSQEEQAMQILNLPDCDIAVDDKKKISYSFRLTPHDGTPVALAVDEGQDLSPWMSAIMAAVVRKSTSYRTTSPVEEALDLGEARRQAASQSYQTSTDGMLRFGMDADDSYEVPVVFVSRDNSLQFPSDFAANPEPVHSTPKGRGEEESDDELDRYDAPLPPLPAENVDGESSSSESSSDEEEDDTVDSPKLSTKLQKARDSKKIELSENPGIELKEIKRDSFYDTQSEHSGGYPSNWQSCSEPLASDDTGSSDQRLLDATPSRPVMRSESVSSRKRSSTALSMASLDSMGSDLDLATVQESSTEKKSHKVFRPPKGKKRRKLTSAESEKQFLQDPTAAHCGKLYQKRRLGVWTKRYCKIIDNRLRCYRHPDDEKPCIDFPLLGYDITLIDSKESKKGYAFKISHPNMEALYFATDSRNSVERWIEILSLSATGQLENVAPYPPYFSAGANVSRGSRESLISSEDALTADSVDDVDNSSGSPQLLPKHHGPYDDVSGFTAADEFEDDASSDARDNHDLKSRSRRKLGSQQSSVDSQASDCLLKRHRDVNSPRDLHSGSDTPGTMSPPHSVFIADSSEVEKQNTTPSEERSKEEQKKEKEKKGWAEALKIKRATIGRRTSLEHLKEKTSPADVSNAKFKQNTLKKSGHSFSHLLTLFDREGKFSGFLTEIKASKFSTTQLRRWCVVRNGVLQLYSSEIEDNPVSKLSLVEMYVTEEVDEEKRKYLFRLRDKDNKTFVFQSSNKEEFQKWMGVLNLFTDLRSSPEKINRGHATLKKLDSGSFSDENSFDRSSTHSKSVRYSGEKVRKEDSPNSPPGKRQSLKTKLSQRVNVREIFRRAHSSYDMADGAHNEENAPLTSDVDAVAFKGGFLTEMNMSEDSYVRNTRRWCTVRGKMFEVYTDYKACDPIKQIPLQQAWIIDNSDLENKLFRFQIRLKNKEFVFLTTDKTDLDRWLKHLEGAVSSSSEDEPILRCMVRIPSPGIKMHRRTQSETFGHKTPESSQSSASVLSQPPGNEKWTSSGSFKSSSSSVQLTDKLMAGYLQEMHEKSGAVTLLRRWCVATSDKFLVYYNEESEKPLKYWSLATIQVTDDSNNPATDLFGFCVHHESNLIAFQHVNHQVIKQWLSVFARYCPQAKDDTTTNQLPRQQYKKSASDNDIKVENESRKLFRVFSEGRASGAKLFRKVSDDGFFPLRKFSRPELHRSSFKSPDKPEVKLRDKSSLSSYDEERRFSCGSLFDSDGKFSGFLMELTSNDKCRSQVRRWCVLKNDELHVFDFEGASSPRKVIPLENAKLTRKIDYENGTYLFSVNYSGEEKVDFRAISRTDLEKWTTVISVKNAVIKARSDRDLRRQSREFAPRIVEEAPSSTDLRCNCEAVNSPDRERNLLIPSKHSSSMTSAEGTEWRLKSSSFSSFAPSEDSVFNVESRMDEIGVGAGVGSSGWKIQQSGESGGSSEEDASSNSEKGLYAGESLKDFFELVTSPSDQVARDLERINLADYHNPGEDLKLGSNLDQNDLCKDFKNDVKSTDNLALDLGNKLCSKVDSPSPSGEITKGFERIDLRERSESETFTQDTYFGHVTSKRNSEEFVNFGREQHTEHERDIIAQWLKDLVDFVAEETCVARSNIKNAEHNDTLIECSKQGECPVESTYFGSRIDTLCPSVNKSQSQNKNGSVRSFLEELVSSVAQDFGETMSLGLESAKKEDRTLRNSLAEDNDHDADSKTLTSLVPSVSEDAIEGCNQDMYNDCAAGIDLMQAANKTTSNQQDYEPVTSSDSSFSSLRHSMMEDQASLTVDEILEAHVDAHVSSCEEDLNESATDNDLSTELEAETSLPSIAPTEKQDISTMSGQSDFINSISESSSVCAVSDFGKVLDSSNFEETLNLHCNEGRETLVQQNELDQEPSEVTKTAARLREEEIPKTDSPACVSPESLAVSQDHACDKHQLTAGGVKCEEMRMSQEELSRSQVDIINAVSEVFQDIEDILVESDSESEETKL